MQRHGGAIVSADSPSKGPDLAPFRVERRISAIRNIFDINDTTQGWSAGYTGSPCTVNIGEWSDGLISLIANVNRNGACPMAAGDSITVTV